MPDSPNDTLLAASQTLFEGTQISGGSLTALAGTVPIKNMTKVHIILHPENEIDGAEAADLLLKCTQKTLPGISDAETWVISTDDVEQEIAETVTGKFGGITALEFTLTYDPALMAQLVDYAKTSHEVRVFYDNPKWSYYVGIAVPGCEIISPGSTSSGANASAGEMTVKLQPAGGGLIKDVLKVFKANKGGS
ncbi:hypothetical protein FACS189419_05050 [Planctomycetales bacterium]|nr:hypothetical protein FACS189419_05050 [Planctomycetales bacterium]